jgi:hypothetical protein
VPYKVVKSRVPLGPSSQDESFAFFRPLAVHCKTFKIEDGKIIKIKNPDKNGIVWFRKKWLESKSVWEEGWLDAIILSLRRKYNFKFGISNYTI